MSYAAIVDVAATADPQERSYVTPGDLDESYLWQKLVGMKDVDIAGDNMPPGSMLSTDALDVVMTWIEDGASGPPS